MSPNWGVYNEFIKELEGERGEWNVYHVLLKELEGYRDLGVCLVSLDGTHVRFYAVTLKIMSGDLLFHVAGHTAVVKQ